ncbi:cell division/cell wall cluster transcriptional repressor MraZ, partial [bacterium]|nr:cell division/cell wall cluster transcriptional repressor MraZ [bacterium]
DKQGRIVVPPELQERYKFSGEVVIVGACECLELWRPEDWVGEQSQDADATVDSMAESLGF